MSHFSIRLARVDDARHLPAIELAAGELFRAIDGLEGMAGDALTAEQQAALIRKGHSLVAETDGRLVGFISTEPFRRELHICEFSVHPAMQRQGVGSVLLRALGIDARNGGFSALTLTTFTDVPWNAPFYARHGFETIADLDAHPRLGAEIAQDAARGMPHERRCAMILFLD